MKIRRSAPNMRINRRPIPSHDPHGDQWSLQDISAVDGDPIIEIACTRPERAADEEDSEGDPDSDFHFRPRVFPNDNAAMIYIMGRACRDACPDAREAIIEIVKSWGYKIARGK